MMLPQPFPTIQTSPTVILLTDFGPHRLETCIGAYRMEKSERWSGAFCNPVGSHTTKWSLASPFLQMHRGLVPPLRRLSTYFLSLTARLSAANFVNTRTNGSTGSPLTSKVTLPIDLMHPTIHAVRSYGRSQSHKPASLS